MALRQSLPRWWLPWAWEPNSTAAACRTGQTGNRHVDGAPRLQTGLAIGPIFGGMDSEPGNRALGKRWHLQDQGQTYLLKYSFHRSRVMSEIDRPSSAAFILIFR